MAVCTRKWSGRRRSSIWAIGDVFVCAYTSFVFEYSTGARCGSVVMNNITQSRVFVFFNKDQSHRCTCSACSMLTGMYLIFSPPSATCILLLLSNAHTLLNHPASIIISRCRGGPQFYILLLLHTTQQPFFSRCCEVALRPSAEIQYHTVPSENLL